MSASPFLGGPREAGFKAGGTPKQTIRGKRMLEKSKPGYGGMLSS